MIPVRLERFCVYFIKETNPFLRVLDEWWSPRASVKKGTKCFRRLSTVQIFPSSNSFNLSLNQNLCILGWVQELLESKINLSVCIFIDSRPTRRE